MDTVKKTDQTSIAFIIDKSPILDAICNELIASGNEIVFRSESIEDGINQLSTFKALPHVCVIDLDFYDKDVQAQLQALMAQYPAIKLIAHSDSDAPKTVKALLEIGFYGYLLIGSNADDFRKAIDGAANGKRYFSVGVADIAQEYFGNN